MVIIFNAVNLSKGKVVMIYSLALWDRVTHLCVFDLWFRQSLVIMCGAKPLFNQWRFIVNQTSSDEMQRISALEDVVYYVSHFVSASIIVRRAGLLWSQQDFEWRWSVPLFKCLTVLEFSFILFDLCLLITFFNFIMNYVPIVTFWIFTYHKIWILSIMFCFIWSYWIIYF